MRTSPIQPGPGTPPGTTSDPTFETPVPVVARRVADTAAFAVLAVVLGALALRLPAPLRPDALTALMLLTFGALLAVAVPEHRRRERAARAAGVPLRGWTRSAAVWRPSTARPWAALTGLFLVQAALAPSRSTTAVVILATGVVAVTLGLWLARRARRHDLAAARAAHPGAAVVPTALVAIASTRLVRWATAASVVLPDDLDVRGALVADADGLVLRSVGRRARQLLRWGWDDVELHEARHPDAPDAAVLLLTLLAPGRRRFDVTLSVRTGHGPVTAGVVGTALAHLLSRRPVPAGADAAPVRAS